MYLLNKRYIIEKISIEYHNFVSLTIPNGMHLKCALNI